MRPSDGVDRLLEGAIDALDDILYVLDTDGDLVYVNDRAEAVTGTPTEEILSMDPTEFFRPADRERVADDIRQALETGVATLEAPLVTADGEAIPYEFRKRRLTDDDGTVLGIVGTGRDISDRAERERVLEALHGATQELMTAGSEREVAEIVTDTAASVLALAHVGVHRHDARRRALVPVAWTEVVDSVTGEPPALGPDSLAWETFEEGAPNRYDDLDAVDRGRNDGTSFGSELIVPLGNHGVAIAAATEAAAFDDEDQRRMGLLCANATAALDRLAREETLRRREYELERENERLEEFASLVSHDLRNPLNVATGRLEMALAECDSDHLDGVADSLDRMETLIDDMLTLAREGQRVDDVEPVDLADVVGRCWANVRTAGAGLRVEADCTVRADESRLAQAFENLFRNAIEHGGEDVTVTVGELPDGFYVEDDGPGIPEDERGRVFETGHSTIDDGTGFGLRIVKDIVDAHGWDVTVTDGSEGGARFEVVGVETVPGA